MRGMSYKCETGIRLSYEDYDNLHIKIESLESKLVEKDAEIDRYDERLTVRKKEIQKLTEALREAVSYAEYNAPLEVLEKHKDLLG